MEIIREERIVLKESREHISLELHLYQNSDDDAERPRLMIRIDNATPHGKHTRRDMLIFPLDPEAARVIGEVCIKFASTNGG
jgi:hypothetical protein